MTITVAVAVQHFACLLCWFVTKTSVAWTVLLYVSELNTSIPLMWLSAVKNSECQKKFVLRYIFIRLCGVKMWKLQAHAVIYCYIYAWLRFVILVPWLTWYFSYVMCCDSFLSLAVYGEGVSPSPVDWVRRSSPAGSRAEPQPKMILVHFVPETAFGE